MQCLSAYGFTQHARVCTAKKAKREADRKKRFEDSAEGRLQCADELTSAARAKAVDDLPIVVLNFRAGEKIGVTLGGDEAEPLEVTAVAEGGQAFDSLRVGEGYFVQRLRVSDGDWQDPGAETFSDGAAFDALCEGTPKRHGSTRDLRLVHERLESPSDS